MTDKFANISEGKSAFLALAFNAASRPDAEALAALSAQEGLLTPFAVTHIGQDAESWVELLTSGLAFDCRGLAPSGPPVTSGFRIPENEAALLGLAEAPAGEIIVIEPAPHLVEGRGLLPIVRALTGLAAELCKLPGVSGVYWRPAHCWMKPRYFAGVVQEWLKGGPFPGLGLTSLRHAEGGAMVSVGLDYLIGQELYFEARRGLAPAAVARIAVRLVNDLVASGPLQRPAQLRGPEGELIEVQPSADGRRLHVSVAP